jgi:hypothetical protein
LVNPVSGIGDVPDTAGKTVPFKVYWYDVMGRPLLLPSVKNRDATPLPATTDVIVGAPGNVYGTNVVDWAQNADMPRDVLVATRILYPWLLTSPLVITMGEVADDAQKKFVSSNVYW